MHELGVSVPPTMTAAEAERVGTGFVAEGLREAQRLSWVAIEATFASIEPGQSEKTITTRLVKELAALGVKRHWHPPHVRVSRNTTCIYKAEGEKGLALGNDDICFLDIGPVFRLEQFGGLEYEGDVGDTRVVGNAPAMKRCADTARALFHEGCEMWRTEKLTGPALYGRLAARAEEQGYELVREVDGHRLSDFSHRDYCKAGLTEISFVPSTDIWVLEVQLRDRSGGYGAFFEDLLR